ncbi:MAG: hypothetical protein JW827_02980 [Spirochaetes bacterium]|nr:hypothetical protein [Spirochaetota bacterium]
MDLAENTGPMDLKSYIFYLKEGEWQTIFQNTGSLKSIVRKIFLPFGTYPEEGDFFDWIKRMTLIMVSLSKIGWDEIFNASEFLKLRNYIIESGLPKLTEHNYDQTVELIKFLNDISYDYEQDPEKTLKKFCHLLKPENDGRLTIFMILLTEKIVGIDFYGLHTQDRSFLLLQKDAEKFIERMSRDKKEWLKIMGKVKRYFKRSNLLNITKAFGESLFQDNKLPGSEGQSE